MLHVALGIGLLYEACTHLQTFLPDHTYESLELSLRMDTLHAIRWRMHWMHGIVIIE
jgi:hypothetical protein